ncbi:MAG: sulfotransferase domain-containing protein [Desulfovermiculus sp.]
MPRMGLRENTKELKKMASSPEPLIFFDTHSRFPKSFLQSKDFRGLHLIRHPKDVAISCARYHQFSDEEWLHRPWDEYQGRSYQNVITSLPTQRERIIFELHNIAGSEIRDMEAFGPSPAFMTVKYEDLIRDQHMSYWHELLIFLGCDAKEICEGIASFYKKSIMFENSLKRDEHVQNGAPDQWTRVFDQPLNELFDELFPGTLERLGYKDPLSHPVSAMRFCKKKFFFWHTRAGSEEKK